MTTVADAAAASTVRVAAVQMTSGDDVGSNIAQAEDLLRQAADAGAVLAALPENFAFMARSDGDRNAVAEEFGSGPVQSWLSQTARSFGLWLVAGTMPVKADAGRCYSSCLVFDPKGKHRARYDKRHLFDVAIPGSDERYCESSMTVAGDATVVCPTPLGGLGLSVCYDLRFPEHYRAMLEQGMEAIAVPSAFTRPTGAAHWETLVRARAIENLCPVIAAAQCGSHPGGRETWGHALVVDSWGTIVAACGEQPGIALADLDRQAVANIREAFPALGHRKS